MSWNRPAGNGREAILARPQHLLGPGQVVLLVMGGTIGADVYVASALGAPLGSSALFVWLAGAVMAVTIIMAFALCALAVPETGGPYLYARRAFGPLAGFTTGWAVLVAQWAALAALPVAFSGYLQALIGGGTWPPWAVAAVRAAFLLAVTLAVGSGPRLATLANDLLAVARLVPLLLVLVGGMTWAALHPDLALHHLLPLRPPPWQATRATLVPIFWAYAGFEVGSIPAGQVRNPQRTIPLGLVLGIAASAAIYLLVNLTAVLVVPPAQLAESPAPLVACARHAAAGLLPFWPSAPAAAELVLGMGVLASILGTATAIAFAVSHLVVAMAGAGLLPPLLGRLHPRLGTPMPALISLAIPAALASLSTSLLSIVSTAVVCSAFAYLATALAAWRLSPSRAGRAGGVLAAACCLLLFPLTEPAALAAGVALLAAGGVVYAGRRHVPPPTPESWVESFTAVAASPAALAPPRPAAALLEAGTAVPGPPPALNPAWRARFVPSAASLLTRPGRPAPAVDKRAPAP